MSLSHRLSEYIAAAFTGLWIQSFEHEDAIAEIARLCREKRWSLALWDIDRGMQIGPVGGPEPTAGVGAAEGANTPTGASSAAMTAADPVAAVRAIAALADPESSALLVLPNFHRFLASAEVVQALAHQIHQGKTDRTFVVILSPVVNIGGFFSYQARPSLDCLQQGQTTRETEVGVAVRLRSWHWRVKMPPLAKPDGFAGADAAMRLAACPTWLLERARDGTPKTKAVKPATPCAADGEDNIRAIPQGQRNTTLTSMAGRLRRQGLDATEILAALLEINKNRCRPPLDEAEVQRIAAPSDRVRRPGGRRKREARRHESGGPAIRDQVG